MSMTYVSIGDFEHVHASWNYYQEAFSTIINNFGGILRMISDTWFLLAYTTTNYTRDKW